MRALTLAGGLVLAAASGGVHADLYLWKDPATGAMKIYSYPPPWYGNPALERRSPRVERIPERQRVPVVEPAAAPVVPAVPAAKPAPAGPDTPPPPPIVKPPVGGPQ